MGLKSLGTSILPFWKDASVRHKNDDDNWSRGVGGSITDSGLSTGGDMDQRRWKYGWDMDHFIEAPTIT